MNPKSDTTAAHDDADSQMQNPAFLDQETKRLRAEADEMERRARRIRQENDEASGSPSSIISSARGSKFYRAAKRVVGWTLVTGGAVLIGTYAYSYLRRTGAGDAAVEAVAEGMTL